MSQTTHDVSEATGRAEQFQTTHWSVVLLAGQTQAPQGAGALETLCRSYWYPLYAYVRRKGYSPENAQDLTQAFFARLLEKKYLKLAAQERGRFRSFLLKSLQHFLVNEWVRGQAQKRGGGRAILSLDEETSEGRFLQEPAAELSPESLFDKRWAITIVDRAMAQLAADYDADGKGELFLQLKKFLLTESTGEGYRRVSDLLGLSEGAFKVAVHRARQRFRELVRAEIANTVATPAQVDEELRYLMAALNS